MSVKKNLGKKLSLAAVVFGLVAISAVMITGEPASKRPMGVPDDWSHHHLVFSSPGTYEQAIAKGTYSQWLKIQYDPRYILQQMKRNSAAAGGYIPPRTAPQLTAPIAVLGAALANKKPPPSPLKLDWSEDMGSNSSKVGADNFPAKYSFSTSNPSTANCAGGSAPDFVVYNTGVAGRAGQASIIAYDNIYSGLCSATVPQTYWAYNTGGTIETSVSLSLDGTQVAFIHSAATARLVLLKWSATTGSFTGTTHGTTTVTVTSCTGLTTGSAIYGTGIPQGDTIAGCSSPNLTLATAATNSASETLTYSNATATAPASPTSVTNANYRACTAPCMTTINFSHANNDTISSPFVDYAGDNLYVGDAGGYLYKFTGVFNGTPAIAGSPWPVAVASRNATSPVYDSSTNSVYLCDYSSNLDEVNASTGALTQSAHIAGAGQDIQEGPIVDSSTGRVYVFVVGPTTADSGAPTAWQTTETQNFILQFQTGFAGGASPFAGVGHGAIGTGGGTGQWLFIGAFDNPYYTSSNGTGDLYVCGNTNGDANIYQIPITSGTMASTANTGATVSSANTPCSPLAEVYNTNATNGPYDWIYAGVNNHCSATSGGTAGCVMNLIVTQWQASTVYAVNQEILDTNLNIQKVTSVTGDAKSGSSHPTWATSGTTTDNHVTWTNQGTMLAESVGAAYAGGTSGIVVDNIGTASGASQIYFSTLSSETCVTSGTTGGCAVQASQSAP